MAVISEAINDGNGGIARHALDNIMGKGTNHDALHHALQVLGHVVNRFALAQVDLRRRKVERKTSQLMDTHVKSYPRAQRGLFEDHGQRLALQRTRVSPRVGLNLPGKLHQFFDLRRSKVADAEKIPRPTGSALHFPSYTVTRALSRRWAWRLVNSVSTSPMVGWVRSSIS